MTRQESEREILRLRQEVDALKKTLRECQSPIEDRFFANTIELWCVATADGMIRQASEGWLGALGRDAQTLIGSPLLDLVVPDDQESMRTLLQGGAQQLRVRSQTSQGEVRWLEWRSFVKDAIVYASARDITVQAKGVQEAEGIRLLLEAVVNQSPIPMVVATAADASIAFANHAAAEFLGEPETGKYIGMPLAQLLQRKTWQDVLPNGTPVAPNDMPIARALRGETTRNEEMYTVRKDGTVRWEVVNGTPIYDREGNVLAGMITFPDITARKLAAERMARLAQEQQAVLNAISLGIVYLKNRRIQWVNRAYAQMYGYEPEEMRDISIAALYADHEDFLRVGREGYEALACGKTYSTELMMRRKDGSIYWGLVTGQVIDPDNLEEGTIWAVQDTTARRSAEEAVRVTEQRFQRLVQNSSDIIAVLGAAGEQLTLVGPVHQVLGYAPEELTGKDAFSFLHPDDIERAACALAEIVREPLAVKRVEYRYRHKNGEWVSMEAVGTNLLHDPNVKGIVLNVRDVSERKRFQEQLQQAMKMEAVGRLAGGVAHDFNNLLTAILGNVEISMMDLREPDPMIATLHQIHRAAESATTLTRQLLAFSRRQIIEPISLNLNDLVLSIKYMIARLIGEDIELTVVLDSELGSVAVDPGQFEQVLVNLSVNARDAMPKGGKLTITTKNVELDAEYNQLHPGTEMTRCVQLCVADTGQGMSDEVKKHLFEPFFTTKATGRGTGLGLATTFGVVKQAGGSIEVYSELGLGTSFKIYLPRIDKPAEKLAKHLARPAIPRGNETILVVEDESSVRRVVRSILEREGYKVLDASDGVQALAMVNGFPGRIDLLMTDVVMPGMNGKELSDRVKRLHPETKILFTSGYTEDVIVHHGVLDDRLNFIGKPYPFQALARKIREVLDTDGR